MNIRLLSSQVLQQVIDGKSLSDVLPKAIVQLDDPRDRALLQALCFGVCRYYTQLDVILSYLLQKPMNEKDVDVFTLLLVGLYQLIHLRVPEHAAVSETVNAVEKLKKPWAKGLVNAILREYLRSKDEIAEKIKSDDEALYSHPHWWISAIKRHWPDQWQAILESNNMHPPFSLRVNVKNISRDDYLQKLRAENISAQPILETTAGITLAAPIKVDMLPGFSKGDISVQDGAAQLAASLLDLSEGQRILDACAAPGGKLTHILEIESQLSACVAVEKDRDRMVLINENLKRLRANATCICADVKAVKTWWDGQLFDRILLDAPCSASGVVRRHPDIKLLREPQDIKAFAIEQGQILDALWPLLKPGGKLIYATCSIFPEENADVLKAFFARNPEAREEKIDANWGIPCEIGRQILPGQHHMDGFYYACARK